MIVPEYQVYFDEQARADLSKAAGPPFVSSRKEECWRIGGPHLRRGGPA